MADQSKLDEIAQLSDVERDAKAEYEKSRAAAQRARQEQVTAKRKWDEQRDALMQAVARADAEGLATPTELLEAADRPWVWFYRAQERMGR